MQSFLSLSFLSITEIQNTQNVPNYHLIYLLVFTSKFVANTTYPHCLSCPSPYYLFHPYSPASFLKLRTFTKIIVSLFTTKPRSLTLTCDTNLHSALFLYLRLRITIITGRFLLSLIVHSTRENSQSFFMDTIIYF